MPRFLSQLFEKFTPPDFLPRMKQQIVGVAQDFWADGAEDPTLKLRSMLAEKGILKNDQNPESVSSNAQLSPGTSQPSVASAPQRSAPVIWRAEAGEVSEKMWGEGFVMPGEIVMIEALIKPLSLNKEMSVLDIAAGLGGRLQKITADFGVQVTGLEQDPQIAARGMETAIRNGKGKQVSIATYDPGSFSLASKYDSIIARETFYRIENKNKFFAALAVCAKPKAQVSFTDYIVNPEDRDQVAIKAWQAFEVEAAPLSLVEMAEGWAKAGFTISVHEDQTEFYKKEIVLGLKRLAIYLATGVKPDNQTKAVIHEHLQAWTHRAAALEQGMKFYRFYGTKH